MSDWPVGLSTGCFYNRSIFSCIDEILAGGFSLIEVCSSPTHLDYHDAGGVCQLGSKLDALGIGVYSFHAPFADRIDISSPDDDLRGRSVREVLAAVEAAGMLGTRYFVIHPGPENAEQKTGDERLRRIENVAASLSDIAERCHALGMTCVLENKLPHLLFGNTADMLWILGTMKTPEVGVCLDTGHAHLAGELNTVAEKLSRHLCMVHASDNAGSQDDHLPPGRGRIDWTGFLNLLRANRFHGSIIIEMAGRGETQEILHAARQSRQFLRRIAWRLR